MQTLYEGVSGAEIVLLETSSELDGFLTLLERIAAELSWQPGDQLRTYAEAALHLAVVVGETVIGGLQVIVDASGTDLPYRQVWPEASVNGPTAAQETVAHVTILALKEEYRGRPGLFGPLCVELWRCCCARGIDQIVIEATPATLRLYRRIGWPLEIIGSLRPHWGEECCYLCCMGIRQVAEALVRKAYRSASYRALVEQAYRDLLVSRMPVSWDEMLNLPVTDVALTDRACF